MARTLLPAAALALAALAVARTATAAPAADVPEVVADVDGDGKPDKLRIERPGQLILERGAGGGQMVPFSLTGSLREARLGVDGRGRPYVVASVHIGAAWEGVALRWDRGALRELWRGPVGPIGVDGEYEQWLAAQPAGLVRFQRRADVIRCDDHSAVELFREGWDERAGRFRAIRPDVRIPDNLPTLQATPLATPAAAGWYRAVAASTASGATDAGALTAPRALGDGDPATAWREDRGGDGRGELFTFRASAQGGLAAGLAIVPGDARDAASLRAANRVARVAVLAADGGYLISIPDPVGAGRVAEPYWAAFPRPLTGCVTVVIVDVHRGTRVRPGTGDTVIAELAVVADVELAPGGAETTLAAQVAKGGLSGESAARALASRGQAAVVALTAELQRATPEGRRRLLGALVELRHPGVVAPLAAALAADELAAADRDAAAATLARLGRDGEAALTALVAGRSPGQQPIDDAVRIAAARALARIRPNALVGAAGTGGRTFRSIIVTLLVPLGASDLAVLAAGGGAPPDATPPSPAAAADLWRAAGRAAAGASPADRAAVAAAMQAALDGATDYELRYRLLAALGPIADGPGVRRMKAWLTRAGDDGRARALRRVATGALAANPTTDARLVLAELTADRDAGTRLAAVAALTTESTTGPTDTPGSRPMISAAETTARDAGDRALATALSGDTWPEVRRGAATALGLRCARPGPRAALDDALAHDTDIEVRIDALTSLVTCAAPGVARRLLAVIDDGRAPLPLREQALSLYAGLPGDVAVLLERFERWRRQAFSDQSSLRLAVRAAAALGASHDRRAAAPLRAAASDAAFPELQAAAAAGLGALGKACPRDALALLRTLSSSEQRSVALAARGAAQKCGK